jgi:hypothetical protein
MPRGQGDRFDAKPHLIPTPTPTPTPYPLPLPLPLAPTPHPSHPPASHPSHPPPPTPPPWLRCSLFDGFGFSQVTIMKPNPNPSPHPNPTPIPNPHQVTVLKSARALGLVCHLVNGKSREEKALQEGTWAHQYHQARVLSPNPNPNPNPDPNPNLSPSPSPIPNPKQARFSALRDRGVHLQNIVYYRPSNPNPHPNPNHSPNLHPSPHPRPHPHPNPHQVYYRSSGAFSDVASHYFVMTAQSDSLLQA